MATRYYFNLSTGRYEAERDGERIASRTTVTGIIRRVRKISPARAHFDSSPGALCGLTWKS